VDMVLSPQARLATSSDQATKSLPSTGDYWRQLATSSPPPRPATSGDHKKWCQAPSGERHAEQSVLWWFKSKTTPKLNYTCYKCI
ncbi:hypothetical protein A2U01_0080424, partial [Trifolium medium]|nr:hypothetical protein [Trifolium medium]